MIDSARLKILKRASWAGIIGNSLLAALKIFTGLFSGSLAVAGDGVDSLSDVVTSVVTLYAAKAGSAPPDPEHPWGHGRAETIATKTLSLIIIMAGLQLLTMTIRKWSGDYEIPGRPALAASGISVLGKSVLAAWKYRAGRKTGSRMMQADARNMRNDIVLSLTVLTGVLFTRVLNLPFIDIAVGFCVSIWIMYSGIQIFLHTNTELMDSIDDWGIYRQVFEAVNVTDGVSNPHRVRIRGLNSLYVIDLDVEVDGSLSVLEAHALACRLEEEIRRRVQKIYDIMVHVEPAGGDNHHEGYGLVPGDVES